MKLSTRGRYGTRVLLDLALQQGREPVPLKEIAERQEVSLQYLEHLIAPLISRGLVRSVRGAKGGILLAKRPEEIKLSEVIELLEGSVAPVECVDSPEICGRASFCVTRDVWGELKRAIAGVLESITIQDLVERYRQKVSPHQAMYHI
jgi:Rrf2 family protein